MSPCYMTVSVEEEAVGKARSCIISVPKLLTDKREKQADKSTKR